MPVIIRSFEDGDVADAITMLLNPMIAIGIGEKSLKKPISKEIVTQYDSLIPMCMELSRKRGISDQDIRDVQGFIEQVACQDESLADFVRKFVTKTLTIGVTAKTVNKALGKEVVPEFKCMLANKYFEHPDAILGKSFAITEKLDGIRCIAMVTGDEVCLFSRQGQPITGLDEIESTLANIRAGYSKDFVFDGELLVTDRDSIPSKEQYKRTTQIVRTEKAHKQGITYNVFDMLELDAFQSQHCEMPYYMRRQRLDVLGDTVHDPSIRVVPV